MCQFYVTDSAAANEERIKNTAKYYVMFKHMLQENLCGTTISTEVQLVFLSRRRV